MTGEKSNGANVAGTTLRFPGQPVTRCCAGCGDQFEVVRPNAKYCRLNCRLDAERRRQEARRGALLDLFA